MKLRIATELYVGRQANNVTESLQKLLLELEQFGSGNDGAIADRPRRMLNITRDTGEFLSVLVRAMNAQRVLEIGTSNGYSTLWLALAAKAIKGHVTTVELSDFKLALAAKNFERSGVEKAPGKRNVAPGTDGMPLRRLQMCRTDEDDARRNR